MAKQGLFQNQDGGSIPSSPLQMIYPDKIIVEQTDMGVMVPYQKNMSRATWRPAAGRKLAFLIKHDKNLIGLISLSSPVINLTVRDNYLKLDKDMSKKGTQLRCYMEMCVCVGIQPLSWHWNIGKLLAMIATTLGDFISARYADDEFKGIVTTSLYGHGSQYNRVYKFLGYTKGYGHEHVSDDQYHKMMDWLKKNNIPIPSNRFGAGSNSRMRRISAYIKASGEKLTLKHGHRRGVYYHEAIAVQKRDDVIKQWYTRWGLSRYERTKNSKPPYVTGK